MTEATTFVGREPELAEGERLLAETRFLTVTGPGGAGKTRFAMQLAGRVRQRFDDAAVTCLFAPLRDAELVLPTIAQALGARDAVGKGALELVADRLGDSKALLFLDNLEHLLAATPDLARLVDSCPSVTVLCTSRERLRVEAEITYELPPLDVEDGVALFCERAHTEPSTSIQELCRRLDGLPLAIELAAARMRVVSPEQLLDRLTKRLDLLKGSSDADPRQETVRATIRWSYDLLTPRERTLFARLSVFADGCTVDAARAVCDASPEALVSLADKSLLRVCDDRVSMLETIREFAGEALRASAELEAVLDRHAAYFLDVADRSTAAHYGDETVEDRARLNADRANLRSALERTIETGDTDGALRFVRSLGDHWHAMGQFTDGFGLARRALALEGGDAVDRAHALHRCGRLAFELGDDACGRHDFALAESMLAASGDRHGLWQVVQERAFYEGVFQQHEDARRFGERAVSLAEELGDADLENLSAAVVAQVLLDAELARSARDPAALQRIALMHQRALSWARSEGNESQELNLSANHGWLLLVTGDAHGALELLRHALRLSVDNGIAWPAVKGIVLAIGLATVRADRPWDGARLLAAALAEFEREGQRPHRSEERYVADAQAAARHALGDGAYDQAVREGCILAPEQVIELALAW